MTYFFVNVICRNQWLNTHIDQFWWSYVKTFVSYAWQNVQTNRQTDKRTYLPKKWQLINVHGLQNAIVVVVKGNEGQANGGTRRPADAPSRITYWGRDKMAQIFPISYSNWFSLYEYYGAIMWISFKLIIIQHRFLYWLCLVTPMPNVTKGCHFCKLFNKCQNKSV